jgi:hypothetical protein
VDVSTRIGTATTFVWLGMVLAISFLEAPLKFRAPGVSLRIGLGIGRLIFRALNTFELLFAVVIAVAFFFRPPTGLDIAFGAAVMALLFQMVLVRPLLSRRTTEVLAGDDGSEGERSRAHYWYIGLELVKVIALLIAGIGLLSA